MIIKFDTRIPTDVKIENNNPNIFVFDKKEKCIFFYRSRDIKIRQYTNSGTEKI